MLSNQYSFCPQNYDTIGYIIKLYFTIYKFWMTCDSRSTCVAFRRSGMTDRRRYGHLYATWRYHVDCRGYESNLTECDHSINYTTSRDVYISCNNKGT